MLFYGGLCLSTGHPVQFAQHPGQQKHEPAVEQMNPEVHPLEGGRRKAVQGMVDPEAQHGQGAVRRKGAERGVPGLRQGGRRKVLDMDLVVLDDVDVIV